MPAIARALAPFTILFGTLFGALATSAHAQPFARMTGSEVENDGLYSEGAAWGDIDQDGDLDLHIANILSQVNLLYRNDAGTFARILSGAPVASGANTYGGFFADLDNDGFLDLYVNHGTSNTGTSNVHYRGTGGGAFAVAGSGPHVTDAGRSWSTCAADTDNDGDLDIYAANHKAVNGVYRNDGGNVFTSITSAPIATNAGASLGSSWADYDNDGDADLFVANGNFIAGQVNLFYRNEGNNVFARITTGEFGTDIANSVGASWGDADNDGDLDLYVTNYSGANNYYYRNEGAGAFAKVVTGGFVTDGGNSVCGAWGDCDNDGDLDLFVANDLNEDNILYLNNGDGTFVTVVAGAIVNDAGRSNGSAWADYDGDGDLDLVVTNGDNPVVQSNFLYRNDQANGNGWIQITLEGTISNLSAIGAKARLLATIGGNTFWQMREVSTQTGYNAMNSLPVEFGLGDAAQVDSLVIEWPSGIVERFGTFSVNQFMTIVESPTTGVAGVVGGAFDGAQSVPGTRAAVLHANEPNPFNPVTTIRFTMNRAGRATITIYDTAGRVVARPLDRAVEAGEHETRFTTADGAPASGVYFYELAIDGVRTAARRMTLIR